MSNMTLEPCPFCGGAAELLTGLAPFVECSECAATGAQTESEHCAAQAWNRRAHLAQPAQAVDVERVLIALGHVRVPNARCLARKAETPPELRPPGPQNPPMWCCLPQGHDGQHRHNGGGMYPSIPFRDTDEIVMGNPLPDYCEKCNRVWPCDDAKAVTRALSCEKAGPVGDGWQAAFQEQRAVAMRAHTICYETMLAHPEVAELSDDGRLHDAIHDILRVDGPASPTPGKGVTDAG